MKKNPTVHIDERAPQFTRNVPNFYIACLITKIERSQVAEVAEKSRDLEKRLRVMEGFSTLSLDEVFLVPNLVIPPKFKVPKFEKYKRDRCPRHHLVMFYRKMTSYTHDDKLTINYFQDSLTC